MGLGDFINSARRLEVPKAKGVWSHNLDQIIRGRPAGAGMELCSGAAVQPYQLSTYPTPTFSWTLGQP